MVTGDFESAKADAVGVGVDLVATVVPVLPGGASIAIKAGRAADRANDTARAAKTIRRGTRKLPFEDADRVTEVNKTLDRIESGGPLPYKQDGAVFNNREGLLPKGNYREYTVDTPGATNRGPRRIVVDEDTGRVFYTDNHYKNFVEIDPERW